MVASSNAPHESVVSRDAVQHFDGVYLITSDVIRALRVHCRGLYGLPTDKLPNTAGATELYVLFRICHAAYYEQRVESDLSRERCRKELVDFMAAKTGLPYVVVHAATVHSLTRERIPQALAQDYAAICKAAHAPLPPYAPVLPLGATQLE